MKSSLQWWEGESEPASECVREREEPLLGFAGDQYKRERGGRVKQTDCLESNKTRRLRGAGSSFGSFD